MSVYDFDTLAAHYGHDVKISKYVGFEEDGTQVDVNVAIECETCYEVLLDFDKREKANMVCSTCNSDEVFYDAYVGVNDDGDIRKFDAVFCDNCGGETSLKTEEEDNA